MNMYLPKKWDSRSETEDHGKEKNVEEERGA